MNTDSTFPECVDSLIFYQDMDLRHKDVFVNYQNLLTQKKHEESALYIKASGIPYYGSDLFNLIENMIYKLQTYLIQSCNENLFINSNNEPDVPNGTFWF